MSLLLLLQTEASVTALPFTGTVDLTGQTPTITTAVEVTAALATVTLIGLAPTVEGGGALVQRLTPDAVLAGGSNLQDTDLVSPPIRVADLADETSGSPGPDALFWTAIDPEADVDVRLSFPATGGNLVGAQTINIWLRGTSLPSRDVTVELWESGSKLTSEVTEPVTSIDGQIVTLNFDPSELSDQSGAGVEVRIFATAA